MLNSQEYAEVFQGCNSSISILARQSPSQLQRWATEAGGHKALLQTTPSTHFGTRCFQTGLCISFHGQVLSLRAHELPDTAEPPATFLVTRKRFWMFFSPVLALILPFCFQLSFLPWMLQLKHTKLAGQAQWQARKPSQHKAVQQAMEGNWNPKWQYLPQHNA